MANHKSAEKAARKSARRRLINRSVKSLVKTQIKKAEGRVFSEDGESSGPAVLIAVKALDRAAKKGVLHPNNAARRKSRLMKKYNGVSTG